MSQSIMSTTLAYFINTKNTSTMMLLAAKTLALPTGISFTSQITSERDEVTNVEIILNKIKQYIKLDNKHLVNYNGDGDGYDAYGLY